MRCTTLFKTVILCFSLFVFSGASWAYPDKDIKHIMPWGAGGGTDTVVRAFMKNMERNLGKKVYTVNISGAKSGLGVAELMNSQADGYTIGTLTYDSIVTVPYFGLLSDYSLDKLDYISTVTLHPTVVAVHVDSPYQNLSDLIDAAKKEPGKIQVSNVGFGGVWHLPMVDLENEAGVEFDHVVFSSGSGEQREALLKRETDVACMSLGGVYALLRAKKARIIGIMSEERLETYPDVPTVKEQGYDVVWGGARIIAIPKDVDEASKQVLTEAALKTVNSSKWKKWLEKNGGGWAYADPEQTEAYISALQNKVFSLLDELVAKGKIKKEI